MVIFQPSGRRGYVSQGKTIKEASRDLGVDLEGICGEKAICGKCRVRIEEGLFDKYGIESKMANLTPISETERKFFNLQQERNGYRLACQAGIQGDILVFVPEESRMGKQIVRKAPTDRAIDLKPAVKKYFVELPPATLEEPLGDWERLQTALSEKYGVGNLTIDYQVLFALQGVVRGGDWKVTVSIWMDKEVIKVEPGFVEKGYGLAVDIGTTTVAGYLCDLTNGEIVATASMMNPQVVYGEDVMSRISYSMSNKDGLAQMNQAIVDGLNGLISEAAAQAGIKGQDILDMTIVGNTCMHHIFLNLDPQYIGKAPFPPSIHHSLDIKARDIGFKVPLEVETDKGIYPPCQVACPAHVNAQDYLYLTAQGKFDEALQLVRRAIPFAGVCGRVCNYPCEVDCERRKVDEPLAIRSIHRFLADYELRAGREKASPVERTKEAKVAIIGSGPAGLACAYDLIKQRYPVTIFEAAPEAGGMLRYGIPEYRLPKDIVDDEISYIEELGVAIKTNTPVKDLKDIFAQGYKAVFLSTGARVSQKMGIPNEDANGVINALDFLKQVNSGDRVDLGEKVAVIGGGNAAVDAARAAKRLGAKEVSIFYRRSLNEMTAIATEVEEAKQEGVKIHFLSAPVEIKTADKRLTGVKYVQMELGEPDDSGRRRPIPVKNSEFSMDADNVIIAIGQTVDKAALPTELEYTSWGTVSVDPVTMQTNIEGVFGGGDVVSGPSDVITSVAAGKEAAISIELYLEGVDLKEGRPPPLERVKEVPKEGVGKEARGIMPELEVEKRGDFSEVEMGFDEETAIKEAKRCLNCGIYAQTEDTEGLEVRGFGLRISPGAYVHVLPIEAGFVGADNVAVLIAEEPEKQDSMELVIDIGTNGELVLGNRKKLVSSSCATGPAFEGAQIRYGMRAAPGAIEKIEIDPDTREVRYQVIGQVGWNVDLEAVEVKGICGSGIIDAIAQMFKAGIIQPSGRFNTDLETPRLRKPESGWEFVIAWAKETSIGQDIVVCQEDVRAMQLAKGAMYAGARLMMRRLGAEKLDKVILAGAFGSFIDKKSAAAIGLFPDCALENITAVGNAAGDGARIALLDVDKRKQADKIARQVEYIELTLEKDFTRQFAYAMYFPHMKDTFPQLKGIVPEKASG